MSWAAMITPTNIPTTPHTMVMIVNWRTTLSLYALAVVIVLYRLPEDETGGRDARPVCGNSVRDIDMQRAACAALCWMPGARMPRDFSRATGIRPRAGFRSDSRRAGRK